MDPRTGQLGQNRDVHQKIIQDLIDAGLLCLRENAEEYESQFESSEKRKRRGAYLPRKLQLSIGWGYELHAFCIKPKVWARIVAGEETVLFSRGAYEGKFFRIQWSFNCGKLQDLYVTYGDEGSVGYEGNIFDLYIDEVP